MHIVPAVALVSAPTIITALLGIAYPASARAQDIPADPRTITTAIQMSGGNDPDQLPGSPPRVAVARNAGESGEDDPEQNPMSRAAASVREGIDVTVAVEPVELVLAGSGSEAHPQGA